jgi:N-acetylneuraminic acid mutarotase
MIGTKLLVRAIVVIVAVVLAAIFLYLTLKPLCSCEHEGVSPTPAAASPDIIGALTWTQKADLPTPRAEIASAVLDGRIYIAGGFEANGDNSNVVEAYDPASGRWQRLAPLPEARDHAMAAAFGGKFYVFGGGGRGGTTSTVFSYDPATDAWSRRADMPLRRTAGGAAVLADRIVVAGGTGDSPATTMLYDPAADRWTAGPPLLASREHLAVVADGGRVYVIGGRWNNELRATNEVLDSTTGSWRRLADMPTARGGTSAGAVNGRIFVAGGEAFDPTRTFPQVEIYDPERDAWSAAPPLPTPRHGLAVQGLGNLLYVIGGGPTAGLSVSPRNEALGPTP